MTKKSNDKALIILEQQYNSFINLQNNWDFFRGLAEYTKTLQETAQIKSVIETLEKQREVAQAIYEQVDRTAFRELSESAEQMSKTAHNIANQYKPIMQAVKEMRGYLNEMTFGSNLLDRLNSSIFTVARLLRENGFADDIKRFEDEQKRVKNIYGNYTFSPAYEVLYEEVEKLEQKEQVWPWGAWQHLPLVKQLVFEPEQYIEDSKSEMEKTPRLQFTLLNLLGVAGEMERIRLGELSDSAALFFKVKDFKKHAQRVHAHITVELLKTGEPSDKLDFNSETSILYFAGVEIVISKAANSDPHDLLKTLFKNRRKIWPTDEILDDWNFEIENKTPLKKAYHAGRAVNNIVAQNTRVKDFLSVTTKSVAINKKYMSD